MSDILVLHGPNLNLLGSREPEVYGSDTLDDVNARLVEDGQRLGVVVSAFQSNSESELIDRIHSAPSDGVKAVIINPAGFTHSSVSLRDALLGVALPFYEVHISNVHAREAFRQLSYFSDAAVGVIAGLGTAGYQYALAAAAARIQSKTQD